ncbi:MAG: lipid-binding SYLF domain-containing protein, partial [Deltaproteobacteria bacterium]|nr:lipid-binding SYLF domain-containing protein [Deltaproteobacteria bacterium]
LLVLMAVLGGCSVTPKSTESGMVLAAEVDEAIAVMKAKDPEIDRFFERSYGYAVLPKVLKGAFVLGGAYGKGIVYQQGQKVGYCNMKQGTLGFSFGGEFFREIVFFRDKEDLDKFKSEEYTFSAQATGVALTAGAAAKADYKSGMAVFITADSGLMVDASLGGQKFNYVPATFRQE